MRITLYYVVARRSQMCLVADIMTITSSTQVFLYDVG